jgi:hypothetical protein
MATAQRGGPCQAEGRRLASDWWVLPRPPVSLARCSLRFSAAAAFNQRSPP